MSKNYKRNLRIGFGVSLFILLITSAASFISIRSLLDSADMVDHTNEVIIQLNGIEAGLRDAEAAQRGYLLTKDAEFLAPFAKAKQRTVDSQMAVKQLTTDNPSQQQTADELKRLIDSRIRVMQNVITIVDSSGLISRTDIQMGKDFTDSTRLNIELMKSREQQLMLERTELMNAFAMYTPVLITVAAIIALIITVSFYSRVSSDFEEKSRLQAELEEKDRVTITQRIDIIRGIAEKISGGNYSVRVSDDQSDALGNVAGTLNKMASSLQTSFTKLSDNEWLQSGIKQLNDVIIGEKPLNKLLASYVTAYAIRIYIMNFFTNTRPPGVRLDNQGFLGPEQISASITMALAGLVIFNAPTWCGATAPQVTHFVAAIRAPRADWFWALLSGTSFGIVAFFSVFIFMFKGRTATFAGLVNRLTSLVAGTTSTLVVWAFLGGKPPKGHDWGALALIFVAVYFLTRAEKRRAAELRG